MKKMRGKNIEFGLSYLLFMVIVSGQEEVVTERDKINLCVFCTCSEIQGEDGIDIVLNIQCSELDKIYNLPDLDKIQWPENRNGLKITAAFESLGLSTLGKLPPNSQVEILRFNNNAIKTYWPDPFIDIPNLKKLTLSQNDLTELTPDLFTNVKKLEDLDFSYNKLSSFNPLDFKTLVHVKRLNFQSNHLKKIPIQALQPMKALEDLDLSKNGIFDLVLERSTSETLKRLKRLNLNGNRIRSINKDSFPVNNSLELLDLSNNIIENIEEDSFLTCTNLHELNLAQNNITFIFAQPPSLKVAILRMNTLQKWPKFPSGITYVDLSFNRLTDFYRVDENDFSNLEVLNLAGNKLRELTMERKLQNLYSLDLSYNLFTDIPQTLSSQNFPSLGELRLDGNPFTNIYFKNILAVRILYLNELNLLDKVEAKAFSNVVGRNMEGESCFALHLSNCRGLSEIEDGAFDATSVCMLDISNNNLTYIPPSLLPWQSVKGGVDLQWNPWDCSCRLQWLLSELLPDMYQRHSNLLTNLRCGSPRAVQGLRLVHWYNWSEPALCKDEANRDSGLGSFLLEPLTEDTTSFFSRYSTLTAILGCTILVCVLIVIGLSVYLIKGRRKYRIRQAAMNRKRQSALDARKSGSVDKEQYSVLNKI